MSLLILTRSGELAAVEGTLAATEGADSASATGAVLRSGSLAVTDGADTASVSGAVFTNSATFALTEFADSTRASQYWNRYWHDDYWSTNYWYARPDGFVADLIVTASLAVTDAADVAASAGDVYVSGSFGPSDSSDSVAATGDVLVAGSCGLIESSDTLSFSGSLISSEVSGELAATEANDTLSLHLFSGVDLEGVLDCTESPDTADFREAKPQSSPGGSVRRKRYVRIAELSGSERRDVCEMRGSVDWSGDDEEIILMSEAA